MKARGYEVEELNKKIEALSPCNSNKPSSSSCGIKKFFSSETVTIAISAIKFRQGI